MLLKIEDIKVGERCRRDLGDIDALASNISERGLIHAVAITNDRTLIAGARRLAAVRKLGWSEIAVQVVETIDDAVKIIKAERDENTFRKDFTPTESVALGEKLEAMEKPKAEERKKEGNKKGGCEKRNNKRQAKSSLNNTGLEESQDSISKGRTDVKVASAVGMGKDKYRKAREVVAAAESDPELFGDLPQQMDQKGRVDPVHKEMKRRKEEGTKEKKKPAWCIDDDIASFRKLFERCYKKWTTDKHKAAMIHFFRQLANEV